MSDKVLVRLGDRLVSPNGKIMIWPHQLGGTAMVSGSTELWISHDEPGDVARRLGYHVVDSLVESQASTPPDYGQDPVYVAAEVLSALLSQQRGLCPEGRFSPVWAYAHDALIAALQREATDGV